MIRREPCPLAGAKAINNNRTENMRHTKRLGRLTAKTPISATLSLFIAPVGPLGMFEVIS